ncbi:hypothetical protein [Natronorubrum aibiense]|uniref:PIN domain-containing protein n=1 Tax=Natronorubrum aibiense TaxID=348826 RepID=A0A5P9P5E1_9EURY|nr:hypothetical protein [Natronorubrum aibiense]QFU83379.1 hypothetical protein GCU68_12935 [Natronorubrum aibiense]
MSASEPNRKRVCVDTSVLLNYIQVPFETDQDSSEFLESEDLTKTVGSVVRQELEDRRLVRKQAYLDLLCVAESLDLDSGDMTVPIYEFEPRDVDLPDDVDVTDHDYNHIEELQWELVGADDQEELDNRLSNLRKKIRYMKSRKRKADTHTQRFNKEFSDKLADAIDDEIDNRKDAAVLAQTVAWKYDNRDLDPVPEIIVTLDKYDMIEKEYEINEAIKDTYSIGSMITIESPESFLEALT